MSRFNRIFIPLMVLLITALACIVPGIAEPDTNSISTSVAQTVIAALTQSIQPPVFTPTSVMDTPVVTNTFASTSTFTPVTPTLTATQTLTGTPAFTSTAAIPLISVSVSTNCRSGPGKIYDYRGALLVGEVAEIIARDPSGNYWYIPNPDVKGKFCWLWGEYAIISGNTSSLPVYTPLPSPTPTYTPTPTPKFNVLYAGLDKCKGGWWVEFKLKNTGTISYRSIRIQVRDVKTGITISQSSNFFMNNDGCSLAATRDILEAGKSVVVSAPAFAYNPGGHTLHAAITLCSKIDQKGICATEKINVVP